MATIASSRSLLGTCLVGQEQTEGSVAVYYQAQREQEHTCHKESNLDSGR